MSFVNFFYRRFRRRDSGTQYRTMWQVLHIDLLLMINLVFLIFVGFIILYSAGNEQFSLIVHQAGNIAVAFMVMLILAQIPPWFYQRWSPWIYLLSLAALALVMVKGHTAMGAQRWLNLGLVKVQPSDLMRIALPMVLAWYFGNRTLPPTFKDLIVCAILILIPAAITAKEPDLGSALVLVAGGLCVLLFAGMRWRIIVGIAILASICAPIAWHHLHEYQKQRVLIFLDPEHDPLGAGYHIIQSKIAIGSGGVFGKGWMHGTQSQLHYLPENETDFIFAVAAEEFGLIGCCLLILIYLGITFRSFMIAFQAQDTYSRLLGSGLSMLFFLSVFINMGMVSGLLPVVGLPLPMVSYGGTSMTTLLAGFGILMSIHGHKRLM